MEHNKPNWDKLQAISVLTSDSPKLGPALKKNPYIYIYSQLIMFIYIFTVSCVYIDTSLYLQSAECVHINIYSQLCLY